MALYTSVDRFMKKSVVEKESSPISRVGNAWYRARRKAVAVPPSLSAVLKPRCLRVWGLQAASEENSGIGIKFYGQACHVFYVAYATQFFQFIIAAGSLILCNPSLQKSDAESDQNRG